MKPLMLSCACLLLASGLLLHAASHANGPPSQDPKSKSQLQKSPQIPIEQKTNRSVKGEGGPGQQTQGPQESSVTPQVAPSTELHEKSNRDTKHGAEDSSEFAILFGKKLKITDLLMAVFTFCLVVIGSWQGYQLWRQVSANKETATAAANANALARKSLYITQRPYIKIDDEPPGLIFATLPPLVDKGECTVRFIIGNIGQTPARLTGFGFRYHIVMDGESLPSTPDYPPSLMPSGGHTILHKDEKVSQNRNFVVGTELSAIKNHQKILWVYGYVDYRDELGQRFRAGYARFYDPNAFAKQLNLKIDIRNGYNYDRVRKPEDREGNDWDEPS